VHPKVLIDDLLRQSKTRRHEASRNWLAAGIGRISPTLKARLDRL